MGTAFLRSHGESGDADTTAAIRDLPEIQKKWEKYKAKDIFNADECGLF